MERDEWDTHEARTEAMTRLVSYMDSLQSGYDQGSVGIELTQGMLDRIARELGLEGRIQHAVKDRSKMVKACHQRIAAYAGMKYSSDMKYRVGSFWDPMSETEYAAGDRKVRCYAWFDPDTKTRSIKGAGAKALPIHYA